MSKLASVSSELLECVSNAYNHERTRKSAKAKLHNFQVVCEWFYLIKHFLHFKQSRASIVTSCPLIHLGCVCDINQLNYFVVLYWVEDNVTVFLLSRILCLNSTGLHSTWNPFHKIKYPVNNTWVVDARKWANVTHHHLVVTTRAQHFVISFLRLEFIGSKRQCKLMSSHSVYDEWPEKLVGTHIICLL